jgi:hypothetical protein
MRLVSVVSALVCALAVCNVASAATVDAVQGKVSVNSGNGFKPVPNGAVVKSGDRVMASPGGSAVVNYSNGCFSNVLAGTVVTVIELPDCTTGKLAPDVTGYVVGAAVIGGGVAAAIALSGGDDKPASP